MSESWLEHLDKAWNEVKEENVKPLDKESVGYFMNQMTQEEFNERKNDNKKVEHKFNMIKKDLPICSGNGVTCNCDVKNEK